MKISTFTKEHREQLTIGNTIFRTRCDRTNKAKITVVLRKRPLNSKEIDKREVDILDITGSTTVTVNEPRKNISGDKYVESHVYTFDRIFSERSSNLHVYKSCVYPLVAEVVKGGRCSCFTFGPTNSGKTYTMIGVNVGKTFLNKGILELAAADLFGILGTLDSQSCFGVYVSFFEIYINKVYDLLNKRNLVRTMETKAADVVVKDLTMVSVSNVVEFMSCVTQGITKRKVASNSKNQESSRGHSVLTFDIVNQVNQSTHGKLAFVDLAGSERAADNVNRPTTADGAGINRSLLALKECIRAMDASNPHVPFRDSELTKVLRDMFVTTNARTCMIANVSPASGSSDPTINTIRYANRLYVMRTNCEADVIDVELTDELLNRDCIPNVISKQIDLPTKSSRFGKQDNKKIGNRAEAKQFLPRSMSTIGSSEKSSKFNKFTMEDDKDSGIDVLYKMSSGGSEYSDGNMNLHRSLLNRKGDFRVTPDMRNSEMELSSEKDDDEDIQYSSDDESEDQEESDEEEEESSEEHNSQENDWRSSHDISNQTKLRAIIKPINKEIIDQNECMSRLKDIGITDSINTAPDVLNRKLHARIEHIFEELITLQSELETVENQCNNLLFSVRRTQIDPLGYLSTLRNTIEQKLNKTIEISNSIEVMESLCSLKDALGVLNMSSDSKAKSKFMSKGKAPLKKT